MLVLVALGGGVISQDSVEDREARREQVRICRSWLKAMQNYAGNNELDSALMALDSVLACDAANPDAYYYRGVLLASKGDTAGAMSALEAGIAKAPLSSRLKTQLSRHYLASGNLDDALDLLNAVLMIKKRDPETLYLYGRVMLGKGDTTQALDSFQQAFEVSIEKGVAK